MRLKYVCLLSVFLFAGWNWSSQSTQDCPRPIPVDQVCCGGKLVQDYLCCSNRVTGPEEICCGGRAVANINKDLCCGGRVYPKNEVDCCDGDPAPEGTCSDVSTEIREAHKKFDDFVLKGETKT